MQNLDMERKREIILQKLKLEYEVILQNTTLENVMRYLAEKLKGISGVIDEPPQKDGTLIQHNIQNVIPWQMNKIKVEYTDVVIPQGNIDKSHGYWGNYVAMNYEGMQLQTNTVRIKAECRHPFILPIFDQIWADMLKDFGAERVDAAKPFLSGLTSDAIHKIAINTTSVIAGGEYDNLTSKELKQKAARFDALRYGNVNPDTAQIETAKLAKKSAKPHKAKNKIPPMPSRHADAYRWVLAWELIKPKIEQEPSLKNNFHELRELLLNIADPEISQLKDDTLRKIIKCGTAKKIPSRADFERKNHM